MTFDLTTFSLEILNFLVLVWLLERILYRPVLKAINERQEAIAQKVRDAERESAAAESLKMQYASQLKDWEKEKVRSRESLASELNEGRKQWLEKLRLEEVEERTRLQSLLENQRKSAAHEWHRETLDLAAQFAGSVLNRLASPEVERRICEVFLDDLANIEKQLLNHVTAGISQNSEVVHVTTAYPLSKSLKASISQMVNRMLGGHTCEFSEDPALIAGIKLIAGGTILQANLSDALTLFEGEKSNGNHK